MPELPEVETMRRGILHLVGSRIADAEFPRGPKRPISTTPTPARIAATIRGGQLTAVERFGKRLALEIDLPTGLPSATAAGLGAARGCNADGSR